MCITFFGLDTHTEYRFWLAFNRDEYLERESLPVHEWEDFPGLIGGRDVERGGTWLGFNINGRVAFLTNYKNEGEEGQERDAYLSRGELTVNFLNGSQRPLEYVKAVWPFRYRYRGFNLVVGDLRSGELVLLCNHSPTAVVRLRAGKVYGLSNDRLMRGEKVRRGLTAIAGMSADGGHACWAAKLKAVMLQTYDPTTASSGEPDQEQAERERGTAPTGRSQQKEAGEGEKLYALSPAGPAAVDEPDDLVGGAESFVDASLGESRLAELPPPLAPLPFAEATSDAAPWTWRSAQENETLPKTIFVTAFPTGRGVYGTRSQTILLVDRYSRVYVTEECLTPSGKWISKEFWLQATRLSPDPSEPIRKEKEEEEMGEGQEEEAFYSDGSNFEDIEECTATTSSAANGGTEDIRLVSQKT